MPRQLGNQPLHVQLEGAFERDGGGVVDEDVEASEFNDGGFHGGGD